MMSRFPQRVALLPLSLLLAFATAAAQTPDSPLAAGEAPLSAEQREVLGAVERLFDGMRAADAEVVRAAFHESGRLMTATVDDAGRPVVRETPIASFAASIGRAQPGQLDERIFDVEIRVDGNLATAWTPYEFFAGGEFSHCGVNAFQLARTADGWKIIQITDTRQREGCERRTGGAASAAAGALPAPNARAAAPAEAVRDSIITEFAVRIARDVQADDVGAITAGVVVGDSVVWAQGFGWADRERRVPADAHTIYRVGSISKSFTAVAMMRLVEKGVLALDDPVGRHLPAVERFADRPADAAPITFRQLASHTAGLIREPDLRGAASGPIEGWEHKILESIPHTSYRDPPGAGYAYSNIGYGTLGLAISRAAGSPFTTVVRDEIIEPLGMTSTTFVITPDLVDRLATGYSPRRDGSIDADGPLREHRGRGYKVPNGGVYSTVHDLARFIAAQTGAGAPDFLSEAGRREMQRDQTPADDDAAYGLGFQILENDAGDRFLGHGGSVAGYHAYLLWHPETRIGVVMLRNYTRGAASLASYSRGLMRALVEATTVRTAGGG